ncbi:MAG TPA: cell division protein FtsH, partial [Bacteroidales bacterium]|nr:cell division protein FtsH [Bacteroidales bacterium]
NLSYYDSTGQNEFSFSKPFSEKTAESIDQEVKRIVEEQYNRAKKTLLENKKGVESLAEQLLEKEVIFGDDLIAIFGEKRGKTEESKQSSEPGESPEDDSVVDEIEVTEVPESENSDTTNEETKHDDA